MGSFMRNRARIARSLLEHSRYEILPTPKVEAAVLAAIPAVDDVTLTITASPARGLAATIDLTERLVGHGYRVVPHLAARMIADRAELAALVERLDALGVTDVFCPAGDADPPAGGYTGSVPLLEDLTALGHPFERIGVTGYPEQHPAIADDVTIQSMWDKRRHAAYLVSNLCFDPATLRRWITRVRARGVTLPLLVGLAGPVDRARLVRMAAVAGVAESARFLAGHTEWFLRLGVPGGYSPQRLLDRSGATLADPASGVEGLHIFTFNQLRQTEEWRRQLLALTPA
jgi:methylenetetrahydrofolate reductase (NADPH)